MGFYVSPAPPLYIESLAYFFATDARRWVLYLEPQASSAPLYTFSPCFFFFSMRRTSQMPRGQNVSGIPRHVGGMRAGYTGDSVDSLYMYARRAEDEGRTTGGFTSPVVNAGRTDSSARARAGAEEEEGLRT